MKQYKYTHARTHTLDNLHLYSLIYEHVKFSSQLYIWTVVEGHKIFTLKANPNFSKII